MGGCLMNNNTVDFVFFFFFWMPVFYLNGKRSNSIRINWLKTK